MDAIKTKPVHIGDPVELSIMTKDKKSDNDDTENLEYLSDISSGKNKKIFFFSTNIIN